MQNDIIYFVYCLLFPNGKKYIGMSKSDARARLDNRYRQHKTTAKSGKKTPLYAAWRKYGDPVQTILSFHASREECALAEIDAIKENDSINPEKGYNITSGGEGLNYENNPYLYDLMKIKVWNNLERCNKISQALKGRKFSEAALEANREWKKSEAAKISYIKRWQNEKRRKSASELTKKQMANGHSEFLSKKFKGRKDPRSELGKIIQKEKIKELMNSEKGKAIAKLGYKKMAENPENLEKFRRGTEKWRQSEKNAENCKRMAQLSAEKNRKKVMHVETQQTFNSQTEMAKALGVSGASISLWVKSGKVVRI